MLKPIYEICVFYDAFHFCLFYYILFQPKLHIKQHLSPPIEKLKIRLSKSNPVLAARLNKEGGFQYFGTNNGSVNPNGMVNKLTQNISFLRLGLIIKITIQPHLFPPAFPIKPTHAAHLPQILCI